MNFIHRMDYAPEVEQQIQESRQIKVNVSLKLLLYDLMQNKLIHANLYSSLESKPNLMMAFEDFFVCLNGAKYRIHGKIHHMAGF